MSNFLLLATESHAEGGFGLNLDIFETNVINLAILVGVLFYFGRNIVSNIMSERRSKIAEAIQEAEKRQKEAAGALADEQGKLAQAQAEAERIRQAAAESAKAARESILAKADRDVERLKEVASQDMNTERDRAIAELRQRVAAMAMQRAESQLRSQLDAAAQQRSIDRSIASIRG
ncbi:MAG: F0F1 ATP synthase subunit B [Cyanosarcina radialis HA8281-LM2]|jgi:F-type H+-transporting ATPase subunit b|nr:F0F1 ATP synthase subunit B [Cyanosarcina radialis HA8281-LM2]